MLVNGILSDSQRRGEGVPCKLTLKAEQYDRNIRGYIFKKDELPLTFLDVGKYTRYKSSVGKTIEVTYKVGIELLGYSKIGIGRPKWSVRINDQIPTFPNDVKLQYIGSKKFVFQPVWGDVIKIIEQDDRSTGDTLWIDMSDTCFKVSRSRIDREMDQLVAIAKDFNPLDDVKKKRIFCTSYDGCIVYIKDNKEKEHVYFANKTDRKFIKTDSKLTGRCRCLAGDLFYDVKLPQESKAHQFFLVQDPKRSCSLTSSWDGCALKEIVV